MKIASTLIMVMALSSVSWGKPVVEMTLRKSGGSSNAASRVKRPTPDESIPYSVSCKGTGRGRLKDTTISLNTKVLSGGIKVIQAVEKKGDFNAAPVNYKIDKRDESSGKIRYQTTGFTKFADGGKVTGELNFDEKTKKGLWRVTQTEFDSSTGQIVETKPKLYDVTCDEAQ